MKDEKGMCDCGCGCCGGGGHHGVWGNHFYMLLGILALVYGLVWWAMITYAWPMYMGWVVAGVVLIAIGIVKKWLRMQKM